MQMGACMGAGEMGRLPFGFKGIWYILTMSVLRVCGVVPALLNVHRSIPAFMPQMTWKQARVE